MGFWISKLMSYFGEKEARILILGLDNAGKTTILYRLHLGEVVSTIPTIGFNLETVTYKNIKFSVWDLGGQTSIRPYWRCYYMGTNVSIPDGRRNRPGPARPCLMTSIFETSRRSSMSWIRRTLTGWAPAERSSTRSSRRRS